MSAEEEESGPSNFPSSSFHEREASWQLTNRFEYGPIYLSVGEYRSQPTFCAVELGEEEEEDGTLSPSIQDEVEKWARGPLPQIRFGHTPTPLSQGEGEKGFGSNAGEWIGPKLRKVVLARNVYSQSMFAYRTSTSVSEKKKSLFCTILSNPSQLEHKIEYSQNSFFLATLLFLFLQFPFPFLFPYADFLFFGHFFVFSFFLLSTTFRTRPSSPPMPYGRRFLPSPSPPTAASLSIRILNDRAILFPPSFEIFSGIYLLVALFQERK